MNIKSGLKQMFAKAVSYPRAIGWSVFQQPGGTRVEYSQQVNQSQSSIVMACVNWIARTFPEAPPVVWDVDSEGAKQINTEHPLTALMKRPNNFYSGSQLWAATVLSWVLDGNAYWQKVRNGVSGVIEYWYIPHFMIEPKWPVSDGSVFISHYEYRPGRGEPIRIEVEDIVHLRNGIDPWNIRKGLAPLKAAMRELWTDEEASNYTASILRNAGVPGLVISPDGEMAAEPTPDEIEQAKRYYQQNTTGDHRGEPLVMKGPTKVTQFGFSPEQMNARGLRQIPEERVTALLGLPAAVVGFGTGLEQTKVGATMKEMREQAYENCIVPTQRMFAETITDQALPDFGDTGSVEFGFDLSQVRVLQEDYDAKAKRWATIIEAGYGTIAEGRRAFGLDVSETDKVYIRQVAKMEVPQGTSQLDAAPEPEPLPDPTGAADDDDEDAFGKSFMEFWPEMKAANRAQARLVKQFSRDAVRLEPVFAASLTTGFDKLGDVAAEAAIKHVKAIERALATGKSTDDAELKASPDDEEAARLILESMDLRAWQRQVLDPAFRGHYLRSAQMTHVSINTVMSLGVDLPAPVEAKILAAGGKRMGLVDITNDTKSAIFRALKEGRSVGEGPPALVRRIRDNVPAGRFGKAGPQYRSLMIARTETKYAQNRSSSEIYRASDVVKGMLAFDNQTGFNDDDCTLRDGRTFSFDEADQQMDAEHPNGTLSFAPVV